MKRLLAIGAAMIFLPVLAADNIGSTSDIENQKRYGNCRVWDQVDVFTDEVSHHMQCKQSSWDDETWVSVSQWTKKRYEVRISKGLQFHLEPGIHLKYRFDDKELIQVQADWVDSASAASFPGKKRVTTFLGELAKAKRIVVQVGSEGGRLNLEGSAEAVTDFKERAGLMEGTAQPERK